MLKLILSALLSAVEISLLVVCMMTIVEFLNIGSRGKVISLIQNSTVRQTVLSTLLGAIPGCGGGFASVSLYTHGVISIGALCAAMIASCGDEAFFLIATAPSKYLTLIIILIAIGLVSGLIINLITRKTESCEEGLVLHSEDTHHHLHSESRGGKFKHFIKEHVWHHIIRHHLPSVFLWTFGALLVCDILLQYCNIEGFIEANASYKYVIVLLAVLVGLIPQSGPHLILITLALNGVIPFYVVVVNMITAQGHVSLPLLSHSKKSWIESKLLCAAVGLIAGIICVTTQ